MGFATAWVVLVAVTFMVAEPADKTQVILMPDADGHVGAAEVITEGGAQLLTEAGQMTAVKDGDEAPSEAKIIAIEKVESIFSEALAVEPMIPEKFLLYFQPNSTTLVAESLQLIPDVLETIRARDASYVSIFGHSDTVGSKDYNIKLSSQRALAVRQLLEDQGAVAKTIETASHGEGNPLVKTADNVAEPLNRRVEIIVR